MSEPRRRYDGRPRYRLRDIFRNASSFLETQKRAYVRDERPPVFKKWMHDTVKAWIEDRIRRKLCGVESRQAIVSGRCSACEGPLVSGTKPPSTVLLCEGCGKEKHYFCPICNGKMSHLWDGNSLLFEL